MWSVEDDHIMGVETPSTESLYKRGSKELPCPFYNVRAELEGAVCGEQALTDMTFNGELILVFSAFIM
jgi:hypothetical protein